MKPLLKPSSPSNLYHATMRSPSFGLPSRDQITRLDLRERTGYLIANPSLSVVCGVCWQLHFINKHESLRVLATTSAAHAVGTRREHSTLRVCWQRTGLRWVLQAAEKADKALLLEEMLHLFVAEPVGVYGVRLGMRRCEGLDFTGAHARAAQRETAQGGASAPHRGAQQRHLI